MKNVIRSKNIDGLKVALAIRQLVSSDVLHECYDVEEEGVENILPLYGIFYQWTDEEKAILKEELIEMAAREEVKEAVRWAEQDTDPLLASIPDRSTPSPFILDLQHKAWKAGMKARRKNAATGKEILDSSIGTLCKKDIKLEVI